MIIHNSKSLLEQLSEIEDQIRRVEAIMEELGIELDQERLLKILTGQKAKSILAGKKN